MQKITLLLLVSLFSWNGYAEDGVDAKSIKFGETAAFNGTAKNLGIGVNHGILAAFKEINDKGGIQGKRLELVSYDDNYEPDQAVNNVNKLLTTNKVFGIIGTVGTPTTKAVEPIVSEAKAPLIGSFTGAEILRNPYKPYVVNMRASYFDETEFLIKHLSEDKGFSKIAVFYQNDAFGQAGLEGTKKAIAKRNMQIVATGTYERNSTEIQTALSQIAAAKPEAVMMIGAFAPCAKFILMAKGAGLSSLFASISFVGSESLAKQLKDVGEGVIISQVVPLATDASVAIVNDYQAALNSYDASLPFGSISLEGYMDARLAIEVMKKIDGDITREKFISTLNTMGEIDLGGFKVKYNDSDHHGSSSVYLAVIGKQQVIQYYNDLNDH